uniref:Uncharacterized protein n=1 Tax=Glossina austeni TaxID=7395 RepID=A0A1A9VF25_GLOAU
MPIYMNHTAMIIIVIITISNILNADNILKAKKSLDLKETKRHHSFDHSKHAVSNICIDTTMVGEKEIRKELLMTLFNVIIVLSFFIWFLTPSLTDLKEMHCKLVEFMQLIAEATDVPSLRSTHPTYAWCAFHFARETLDNYAPSYYKAKNTEELEQFLNNTMI